MKDVNNNMVELHELNELNKKLQLENLSLRKELLVAQSFNIQYQHDSVSAQIKQMQDAAMPKPEAPEDKHGHPPIKEPT